MEGQYIQKNSHNYLEKIPPMRKCWKNKCWYCFSGVGSMWARDREKEQLRKKRITGLQAKKKREVQKFGEL